VTSVASGVFTLALLWGLPALFQIDPIGAYFRHTVDPLFNLLVPR